MSQQTELRALALAGIAQRCARETELFFQRRRFDPRYCLELFRRAIVDRSQGAWELAYAQYRPLVAGWVQRHPSFPATGEEVQYFVNRAFEKMWVALPSDRFSRFPNLKSLLRYLQMCVHSAVLDHARAAERALVTEEIEGLASSSTTHIIADDNASLARVYRQEFWDQIGARLRTEKERQVVYGSFVLALKPREIYSRSRDLFGDIREVYRVKENVLARLRRDAELAKILQQDA